MEDRFADRRTKIPRRPELAPDPTRIGLADRPGDHVVLCDDLYGGSRRLFTQIFAKRWGLEVTYVDATDPDNVSGAIRPQTRMIWLEYARVTGAALFEAALTK